MSTRTNMRIELPLLPHQPRISSTHGPCTLVLSSDNHSHDKHVRDPIHNVRPIAQYRLVFASPVRKTICCVWRAVNPRPPITLVPRLMGCRTREPESVLHDTHD